jgi:hypothetical protein
MPCYDYLVFLERGRPGEAGPSAGGDQVAVDNEPPPPDCPRWSFELEREDDHGGFDDGFDELGPAEQSWDVAG